MTNSGRRWLSFCKENMTFGKTNESRWTREDRGGSESTVGKGSSEQRRKYPGQAEDVACRKSKDRGCATSTMGKGQSRQEKGCCLTRSGSKDPTS